MGGIAAVASLVGRVAFGQVVTGGAGAQDPKGAVEDLARLSPGPAASVRRGGGRG